MSYRFDFALTNKRIGALLGTSGREQEAFDRYRKALEIEEEASRQDQINVSKRRAVFVTYSDLGWLYGKTGNPNALSNLLESYSESVLCPFFKATWIISIPTSESAHLLPAQFSL